MSSHSVLHPPLALKSHFLHPASVYVKFLPTTHIDEEQPINAQPPTAAESKLHTMDVYAIMTVTLPSMIYYTSNDNNDTSSVSASPTLSASSESGASASTAVPPSYPDTERSPPPPAYTYHRNIQHPQRVYHVSRDERTHDAPIASPSPPPPYTPLRDNAVQVSSTSYIRREARNWIGAHVRGDGNESDGAELERRSPQQHLQREGRVSRVSRFLWFVTVVGLIACVVGIWIAVGLGKW